MARHIQTEANLKTSIPDLVDSLAPGEQYWLWEPRHLFERMRVQQSLFVFGPAIQWPWGSAPFRVLGRYHFTLDESVVEGGLRPLRDPAEPDEYEFPLLNSGKPFL